MIMDTITADGHRSLTELAQQAAELAWKIATSGDRKIEAYDAPAYRHAEALAEALYFAAYPDGTAATWNRVRDLIAEMGPDDGHNRVEGWGVESYHKGALLEAAQRRVMEASSEFGTSFDDALSTALEAYRAVASDLGTREADFVADLRTVVSAAFRAYGH